MKLLNKSAKNSYFIIIGIIALFLQNIAIFFQHYFYRVGFPWDFDQSTWVTPAFWTTAINLGIFPQWIPYQSMGYPLFLKAQSGLFFPFLWLFPIFNISYTLQAAVIFQILLIFFGSVGMFFFLNHMFKSPKYAILGAVAFQFFGGFFANSEHVTIIRGFVLIPWLFYVFTLNVDKPSITKKTLFIPIVIFLIATGAYPGIFTATIFIMTLFIILQTSNIFAKGFGKRKSLTIAGSLFGLLLLGIILPMVHIGPFIQFGNDELIRFDPSTFLIYNTFTIEQFPGFFMSNTPIPDEISMTSTFLTLPLMIFASFITWTFIKRYWIFFVIFSISFLMAIGNQTPFWSIITSLIPTLDLSRFVISDYRMFIAVPLVVFAISGLKSIIEGQITIRSLAFRIPFIFSWFAFGIILLQNNISRAWRVDYEALSEQINFSLLILGITVFILTIYVIKLKRFSLEKRKYEISTIVMIIIISIIVADGFIVIYDMHTWFRIPYDGRYQAVGIPLEKDGKLTTYSVLENIPDTRPERVADYHHLQLPWRGVLTGEYMMQDTGRPMYFVVKEVTVKNNIYEDYMLMKWAPIFLEPPINVGKNKVELDDKIFSEIDSNLETSVTQTRYGINDINYKVSLEEPKLMVENEIYFLGWTATLIFPDHEEELQAIEVNDVFRAWNLPAGDYEMKANFQFPNFVTYQIISLSAFVIWIIVLIAYFFKTKKSTVSKLN